MPRARRKPRSFQTTDTGPDTPAQRAGAVYERPKGGRPGEVRRRREHPIEDMVRKGTITAAQKERAIAALNLYEAMMKGPGGIREYVQATPDWAEQIAEMVERGFAYGRAVRRIPSGAVYRVFKRVVLEGRPLSRLPGCATDNSTRRLMRDRLRQALDALDV